jgi:predicted aspartyl protease
MQILLHDARRISGYGLLVKVYDRNQRLLLDTGASGVIINRRRRRRQA